MKTKTKTKTKTNKNKNYSVKLSSRSFSPLLNKKLRVHSLKSLKPQTLKLCDNLLSLQIIKNNTVTCKAYNSSSVQELLLYNLKSSKHLDVSRFIAPLQLSANCWFNTMFVTFFFSDKGRKFFRFFRELMITGRKVDNTPIPSSIAKLFFILNLFIEASYNQSTKSKSLFRIMNKLTNKLNTNFFIYHIYQIINNKPNAINPNILLKNDNKLYNIPNVDDAGNPVAYYESILNYLNYNTLQIFRQQFQIKSNIYEILKHHFYNYSFTSILDIIILEDFQTNSKYETSYAFVDSKNITYTYALDSIILTNKDYFNPETNSHFVSVLTCNNEEYKFDGSSSSRFEKFKWKKMINTNKDWTFEENPKYELEHYNFTKGYKILFYYRT